MGDMPRVVADQLHDLQAGMVAQLHFSQDIRAHDVRPVEIGAGDHLGRRIGRTQLLRHAAKRQVGDTGHRRDQHPAGNFDISDKKREANRQGFGHAPSIQDLPQI